MTHAFNMANVAFGGGLADWLIDAREEGMSYQAIMFFLATERGMNVGLDTLARWVKDIYAERAKAQLAS